MGMISYLLLSTAGAGFLAAALLSWCSDILAKKGLSAFTLDEAFAALSRKHDAHSNEREGVLTLLLTGWFLTLGFVLLWLLPGFRIIFSSLFFASLVYAAAIWSVVMIVLLPLLELGMFGKRHHRSVPLSLGLILLIYALILYPIVNSIV